MLKILKENWLFYMLILVVSFILLFPKFPSIFVPGTYVAIRAEDFLIATVLVIWFSVNIKKIPQYIKENITLVFTLFWLAGLLSVLSGIFLTYSVTPHLGLLHWLRRIEVMSLFFIAATTVKSLQHVKQAMLVFTLVTVAVVLYGIGQVFFDFKVISTTNREFSKGQILTLTPGARPNSTFAGHYDLAIYLSFVIVFFGVFFFYREGKKNTLRNILEKSLVAISGVGSFILLALTAARVSFVATLGALAIVFWYTGKRLLIVGLIAATLFAVAAVPQLRHRLVATITVNLLEGGGPKYSPQQDKINIFTRDDKVDQASKAAVIKELIESSKSATLSAQVSTVSADIAPGEPVNTTELGVYRSFNIRTDVEWPMAWRGFLKNPIAGSGYSSLNIATDNDYLRSLGETGILGSLSLVLVFLVLIKQYLKSMVELDRFNKLFVIASLGVIVVLLVTAIFIDVLEASKVAFFFWFIMGVNWSISKGFKGL